VFTRAEQMQIRQIVAEECAKHMRQPTVTTGAGSFSFREYLHDRDEPPDAPPVRGVNTSERL
jgi:hypothetical protein